MNLLYYVAQAVLKHLIFCLDILNAGIPSSFCLCILVSSFSHSVEVYHPALGHLRAVCLKRSFTCKLPLLKSTATFFQLLYLYANTICLVVLLFYSVQIEPQGLVSTSKAFYDHIAYICSLWVSRHVPPVWLITYSKF